MDYIQAVGGFGIRVVFGLMNLADCFGPIIVSWVDCSGGSLEAIVSFFLEASSSAELYLCIGQFPPRSLE